LEALSGTKLPSVGVFAWASPVLDALDDDGADEEEQPATKALRVSNRRDRVMLAGIAAAMPVHDTLASRENGCASRRAPRTDTCHSRVIVSPAYNPQVRPGEVVAERFEIAGEAGSGGMGRVFRARDRLAGGDVALKVLHRGEYAERFAREARLLADLSDPAIVRYVAHGNTGSGQPYLAMEWLEGEDLAQRLSRGTLPVDDGVAVGKRLARALAVAHARGIVHRDIKPSNVFLPGGVVGAAKVLDFGIALSTLPTTPRTRTSAVLGTPGYMAPEQARGTRTVDARADVFALGCVLFECLTGVPAFAGEEPMAILAKILFDEAARTRSMRSDVPLALDELVARMLSKDPRARPADGTCVLRELEDHDPLATEGTHRIPAALGSAEQRFLAVVLARQGGALEDDTRSTLAEDAPPSLRQIASRYGGVAERMVDGTLAVVISGDRGAATDQAVLAARCGLALRRISPNAPMVLAIGRGDVMANRPVGDVIDRAATLLGTTSPGNPIRLDEVAAGLVEGHFAVRRDGASNIELCGELETFEVTRTLLGRPAPCVGRDRELAILEGYFDECVVESRARAVLVTGAPGIGKSRIAHELVARLRARHPSMEIWIARGDAMRAGSPFTHLAPLIRRVAGILDGEALAVRQNKLRARLARRLQGQDLTRATTYLCEIVGAPLDDEDEALVAARRDPRLLGERMRQAWCLWVAAECAAGPVAIVLEDLQWGDVPTLKFLEAALREPGDKPLLVLALARPEIDDLFPKLWAEPGVQQLRLGALGRKPSEALVRNFLGDAVDAATMDRLVRVSAGNAFFLEELIRAVAEGKADSLPETVLAMATARLERLPQGARRVLRAASVFGEVFWEGGVAALVGGADRLRVAEWLGELTEREVVSPRGSARFVGEAEYAFRHALVQDAAYGTLTEEDRVLGHRLAAEWLEAAGEGSHRLLAEHFERGGCATRAGSHYGRAAAQALEGNDFQTSLADVERARVLGEGADLAALALKRGQAYTGLGRWGEARAAYEAALELGSWSAEESAEILVRLAKACFFGFDVPGMTTHAARALALADGLVDRPDLAAESIACLGISKQRTGDLPGSIDAYWDAKKRARGRHFPAAAQLVLTFVWRGEIDLALEQGREVIASARDMNDVTTLLQALPQLGLALAARGRYRDAARVFGEARDIGRKYEGGSFLARAIAMSAGFHLDIFAPEAAAAVALEARELALTFEFTTAHAFASIDLLLSALSRGDVGAAEAILAEVTEAVASLHTFGWHERLHGIRVAAARAEVALARGRWPEAMGHTADCIAHARSVGRVKYEALGLHARARALLAVDRTDEAIADLRSAAAIARRIGCPALLVRAAAELLPLAGDDALLAEARAAVDFMARELSEPLRATFLDAAPVRSVTALSREAAAI
jgi:tetratricopeptide (TPR) repeat protein